MQPEENSPTFPHGEGSPAEEAVPGGQRVILYRGGWANKTRATAGQAIITFTKVFLLKWLFMSLRTVFRDL